MILGVGCEKMAAKERNLRAKRCIGSWVALDFDLRCLVSGRRTHVGMRDGRVAVGSELHFSGQEEWGEALLLYKCNGGVEESSLALVASVSGYLDTRRLV